MKTHVIRTLLVSLAIGTPVLAQQPPPDPRAGQPPATKPVKPLDQAKPASGELAAADKQFVNKAAEGGHAEVELARLAKDKAENAEVKAFAERLERDHTKAGEDLKNLAAQKQITLPSGPPSEAASLKAKLSKLSGAAFDKAYIAAMVSDHQKDVRAFERQAERGVDADVKAFVTRTLPTLKEHLQLAEQLAKTVGARSS